MKKIKIMLIALMIFFSIITIVDPYYAWGKITKEERDGGHTMDEIIEEGKNFIDTGKIKAEDKIKQDNLQKMSNTLYNILLVTGILIALIVGMILGIKFIMGGIEEKAEIKTMIIPYIVGCVVVFGAFTIWKIVVDILQSM